MASQNHNEDENMPMVSETEDMPFPIGDSSTLADKRPSVPNHEAEYSVREAEHTGSGQEENGNEEDLDNDRVSEDQDRTQRDERQQRSSLEAGNYEIKTIEVGEGWWYAKGRMQETVYHSDIRNDLEHHSKRLIPHGGPRYKSKLGAGTDDKTSYHPLFDFCGKERADRPDCLFYFEQPPTRHDDRPTTYILWNGRVVLDYCGVPIRVLNLPLTISSKIGQEEARLEAMLRLNPNVEWSDIMARILRRGDDIGKAKKARNALKMRLLRFRAIARLIPWDHKHGSKALKTYLLTIMTAEMVVNNSTRLLSDMASGSDEKCFVELLNPSRQSRGQAKGNREKRANNKLQRADIWAQTQTTWEAQNPITPAFYGETECTAIESIVAFKLASLKQYGRNGSQVSEGWLIVHHAGPIYNFNNPRMEEFFGSLVYFKEKAILTQDPNDPYGLLSSPTRTAAQRCIMDFLLEPARLLYRGTTLVDTGTEEYIPIFTSNPRHSYWQQLHALQSAFGQHWAELGRGEHPPLLPGLLQLNYNTMIWNTDTVPPLALVRQSIISCDWTFANWQRRQTKRQREKLLQLHRDLDDEDDEEEAMEVEK